MVFPPLYMKEKAPLASCQRGSVSEFAYRLAKGVTRIEPASTGHDSNSMRHELSKPRLAVK
jgi:hypothetical protein